MSGLVQMLSFICVAFSNKASYRLKLFRSVVEAVQRTMLAFSK